MYREALVSVLVGHLLGCLLRPYSEGRHALVNTVASFAMIALNLKSGVGLSLVDDVESSHDVLK